MCMQPSGRGPPGPGWCAGGFCVLRGSHSPPALRLLHQRFHESRRNGALGGSILSTERLRALVQATPFRWGHNSTECGCNSSRPRWLSQALRTAPSPRRFPCPSPFLPSWPLVLPTHTPARERGPWPSGLETTHVLTEP